MGAANQAWHTVRPSRPKVLDRKTNEQVDFLFATRARRVDKHYINKKIIPMLCGKAGVPTQDVRGNITASAGAEYRECGLVSPDTCSTNVTVTHLLLRQRNRRTRRSITTRIPAIAASVSLRRYRPWIRDDARPQPRQFAVPARTPRRQPHQLTDPLHPVDDQASLMRQNGPKIATVAPQP